jgi:starch phosphorylase
VAEAWFDPSRWAHMAITNTAMSGRFSSDRTIAQYRDEIWFPQREI